MTRTEKMQNSIRPYRRMLALFADSLQRMDMWTKFLDPKNSEHRKDLEQAKACARQLPRMYARLLLWERELRRSGGKLTPWQSRKTVERVITQIKGGVRL